MGKGGKKQKKPQNQAKNTVASEVTAVTFDAVAASVTEAEFDKKKTELLQQLQTEIDALNKAKQNIEDEMIRTESKHQAVLREKDDLAAQKEKLQTEYNELQEAYNASVKLISTAEDEASRKLSAATEEADNIKKLAVDQKMSILMEADKKAQEAWEKQADELGKRLAEIGAKRAELRSLEEGLREKEQDLQLSLEMLEMEKEFVQKQKEIYKDSNPTKIQQLEDELAREKENYKNLFSMYEDAKRRTSETQVYLDLIKAEVEDVSGEKRLIATSEILSSMQEFKGKYESLSAIYSKYPDDASIARLKEKADRLERLEQENETLLQERKRYQEEMIAAKNAAKELEVVRREVEATNALNEHLLQELESHKTALENRTGDTCPALTKVDKETEDKEFANLILQRKQKASPKSLKELVLHIKNHAGGRRKEDDRLYYKDDDIRAFLAGMAVSRLLVLEGMSGTGKSSLPRAFAEAISGFDKLIPVESSWRDRNELLGYYNDFNKKFNAKTFTIELYRSGKAQCKDFPTFIVLDEMNLARIEYYFSDFLAILQKPEHEKWLVELVASDMRTLPMELPEDIKIKMQREVPSIHQIWQKIEQSRKGDLGKETSDEEKEELTAYLAKIGKLTGAKDLIDGRKIRVPENVWFVGTANHDDSTFDISDKVYDRAQVIELNEKGKPEKDGYPFTEEKYISADELQEMFSYAIEHNSHRAEVETRLQRIDSFLMEKFDVSFGNRIVRQAVQFVAVFVAAGGKLVDALDYQISTKILRKVLSSENDEALYDLVSVVAEYPKTKRLLNKELKKRGYGGE